MSHRLVAVIAAWTLAAMFVLGSVAALVLHLEHGLGPTPDLLSVPGYSQMFNLHGGAMLAFVLGSGLLTPVANLHVARLREAAGRSGGPGAWIAGAGMLAVLGVSITVLVMLVGRFDSVPAGLSRGLLIGAAVGNIGLGVGVLLGMRGLERGRRGMLGSTVLILASAQLVLGLVNLLTGDGLYQLSVSGLLQFQLALVVGLGVVALHGSNASAPPKLGRAAVVTLVLVALLDTLAAALPSAQIGWFIGLRFTIGAAGMVTALMALLGAARRGDRSSPAWDYAAVLACLFVPMIFVRLYVDSLSIDVHLADTYFAVGDSHLVALLGVAIGGPMALRLSSPQRYAAAPEWLRRATPWLIGAAVLWFSFALLRLGHGGMPRRYYAFLPEFLAGHRRAGVAAVLLEAGLLLEAWLWIRGKRRSTDGSRR